MKYDHTIFFVVGWGRGEGGVGGVVCLLRLRGLNTLGRYFAIFIKGNNFCNFLFALLHAKPLLKKGSTQ